MIQTSNKHPDFSKLRIALTTRTHKVISFFVTTCVHRNKNTCVSIALAIMYHQVWIRYPITLASCLLKLQNVLTIECGKMKLLYYLLIFETCYSFIVLSNIIRNLSPGFQTILLRAIPFDVTITYLVTKPIVNIVLFRHTFLLNYSIIVYNSIIF